MNRARSLGFVLALSAVAACSASSSSSPETAGSEEQAITKCAIDSPSCPDPAPCVGLTCGKKVLCHGSLPAGDQCGTYTESCSDDSSYSVTVGCASDQACTGGVCSICPPGSTTTETDAGDVVCAGTCDHDPSTGQPLDCELTLSIFELLAPSPSGDLMVATNNYVSGTVLPCTVWNFDESKSGSDVDYSYFVAYCKDSPTATGTVMGDWATAVNTKYATIQATIGTDDGGTQTVVEQANGDSTTDIDRGAPYDALLTSQPRTLGPQAPGWVYVEFHANPLHPPVYCTYPHGIPHCDNGCSNSNDMSCIFNPPTVVPMPIQVQPTPPPFGQSVAGGF